MRTVAASLASLWLSTAALAAEPGDTAIRRCTDAAKPLPAAIEDAKRRTVRIETLLGTGSGVIVSPDGFVLTAAHVVGTAETVKVVLVDGSSIDGKVVRVHDAADLALVRVAKSGLPCLPIAADHLPSGHEVFLIGAPGGAVLTHSVAKGIVSAWRDVDGWSVLQTDASVNHGNSGGAVIDASGKVQGIVSFKAVGLGVEGLGFAMGANSATKALRVAWSDATAADVAVWRDDTPSKGSAGIGGRVGALATVENRPATPGEIPAKNACRKVGGETEVDRITGATTTEVKQDGQYTIRWAKGEAPRVTVKFGMFMMPGIAVLGQNVGPAGSVTATAALDDGTRISFSSVAATVRPEFWGMAVEAEFPLSDDAVLAMAASPPVLWRWQVRDQTANDMEKPKSDWPKWQNGFACLAVEMGLAKEE